MTKSTCNIDGCDKPVKTRGMCGMHIERVRRWGDPNTFGAYIKGDDERRFWSKVDRRGEDECWLWSGTIVTDGYGQFRSGERRVPAHRYAYELLVGPIPDGLQLDHVWDRGCFNRNCVNPTHLEPVTPAENLKRGNTISTVNARKTHCIRGHAFTVVMSDGKPRRRCMTCAGWTPQRRRAEDLGRAAR